MCGRFTNTASPEELMRKFGVTVLDNLQPRWNVAPSQSALVIHQTGLQPEAIMPKWGLPPSAEGRSFLINARMETAAEKPTFSQAFARHRCLVVASGWYEWSEPKKPWHIQLADGGLMVFGGLVLPYGKEQRFVIMTAASNGDLKAIHHRQPLVLPPASWQPWLTGTAADASRLCVAQPSDWFNWYRVGPSVGRVAEDHPELVTPLDEVALAAENRAHSVSVQPKKTNDTRQGDLFG